MNTDCLLPSDLLRFALEGPEPTSVCSLYLRLPSSPLFSQFTVLDYLIFIAQAMVIEIPIYYFIVSRWKLLRAVRMSVLLNVSTHPFVFFVWPFLGAALNWSIGSSLLISLCFSWSVRYLLLRGAFREGPFVSWWGGFAASLVSWWMGVILSY